MSARRKLHISLKNDRGNIAAGSPGIVDGAADGRTYLVNIAVEGAVAVHVGIAGAGSIAVVVNAAAANVREILGEGRPHHLRQAFAAFCNVEDGGAVGSLIFFKQAVDDGRRAEAEAAVVVQSATVEVGVVVDELAIFDAWAGGAIVGVVVECGAVAAIVVDEKAIQDAGVGVAVGAVVVPAGAAALRSAFLAYRAVGCAGADNEAVNGSSGAYVFSQYNGVGIVFQRVSGADFTAQYSEVDAPVALFRAAFEAGETSQKHYAVRNNEGCIAITGGSRKVLAAGYPDLNRGGLAGSMKSRLQIAESVLPG